MTEDVILVGARANMIIMDDLHDEPSKAQAFVDQAKVLIKSGEEPTEEQSIALKAQWDDLTVDEQEEVKQLGAQVTDIRDEVELPRRSFTGRHRVGLASAVAAMRGISALASVVRPIEASPGRYARGKTILNPENTGKYKPHQGTREMERRRRAL